jgi:hypothetical protein
LFIDIKFILFNEISTILIIFPPDRLSHITLKLKEDVEYSTFEIKLDFGDFRGYNQNAHLLNLEPFVKDLKKFVADIKQVPTIKRTYDFHLKVPVVGANIVWTDR